MKRVTSSAALFALCVSCAAAGPLNSSPNRVVSLDFCADQFVLKLLDRVQILAVSPDAEKDFSYMRREAAGVPSVRPIAEDVLVIGPDLIVRSYGGGPHAAAFFERAGVPVLQVPFANDLQGIRNAINTVAARLDKTAEGNAVVEEMNRRLAAIQQGNENKNVLYMTPTGVTSGPDTLVHEMLLAAGLTNFQKSTGWRSLPLERLAYEQPDVVAAAFFDLKTNHPSVWSAMRHPVAQRQLSERPTVLLQGAWTACGAWFLMDAIEALSKAANQ